MNRAFVIDRLREAGYEALPAGDMGFDGFYVYTDPGWHLYFATSWGGDDQHERLQTYVTEDDGRLMNCYDNQWPEGPRPDDNPHRIVVWAIARVLEFKARRAAGTLKVTAEVGL